MHDMAVTIAEAVASSYLSQARAGTLPKAPPDIQGTVDSPQPYLQDTQIFSSGAPPQAGVFSNTTVATYVHPSIASSRSLERFRNQVLLAQWVDRKWWGVRRVLEDTQQLWLIRPGGRLQPRSLAVKRTQVGVSLRKYTLVVTCDNPHTHTFMHRSSRHSLGGHYCCRCCLRWGMLLVHCS